MNDDTILIKNANGPDISVSKEKLENVVQAQIEIINIFSERFGKSDDLLLVGLVISMVIGMIIQSYRITDDSIDNFISDLVYNAKTFNEYGGQGIILKNASKTKQ